MGLWALNGGHVPVFGVSGEGRAGDEPSLFGPSPSGDRQG